MKVSSAVAKLTKSGFTVTQDGSRFWAKHPNSNKLISFYKNGGDSDSITCLKARREDDHDDGMTDYYAGQFYDSMAQAIRYASPSTPSNQA